MGKDLSGSVSFPVHLDQEDKKLMDALRGPKGDKGDRGDSVKGDSIKGADSIVPGPKGDKGDSVQGPKGDKGDPSFIMGPRGDTGPPLSREEMKELIREVMKGF